MLDVDVVVELRPERVGDFCAALGGELFVDLDAAMAAVVRGSMFRINLREWGLKVNVIVSPPEGDAAHGFGCAVRTRLQPGWEAMFSSPEDSIVSKIQFFREGGSEKHLRNIA